MLKANARWLSRNGIDNLNDYDHSQALTPRTTGESTPETDEKFSFFEMDLADREKISDLFKAQHFEIVVNLASQAGVRYSLKNPHAYADANLTGFLNILEGCRHIKPSHLLFASSSSVMG